MRVKSKKHLDFIRQLPCCICGDNVTVEAAHIRMADARINKPITGNSIKPDDKYTVPLCGKHHREQHEGSEREFWEHHQKDPILLALYLYSCESHEEAEEIISWASLRPIPIPS